MLCAKAMHGQRESDMAQHAACMQTRNGSFNLHALSDAGVQVPSATNAWEILQVAPMDTALVALGEPDVLPDIVGPAKTEKGFNFNLFNNAWGTNYVMWTPYGDGVGKRNKCRCAVSTIMNSSCLRRKPADRARKCSNTMRYP